MQRASDGSVGAGSRQINYEPQPVTITTKQLFAQAKVDVFGKETASAATYSYLWLADQMGHLALGLLLGFVACKVADIWLDSAVWIAVASTAVCVVVFGLWEFAAYRSAVKDAGGHFPVDERLTRRNAIVAAAYMVLGGVLAAALYLGDAVVAAGGWGLEVALVIALLLIAVLMAPFWVRQKMIWQKAGLPYLARLWSIQVTFGATEDATQKVAKRLVQLIDDRPGVDQLVIWGPPQTGKTGLAAAIGTELAFKNRKVRYESFDRLAQLVFAETDDGGPSNIAYWPWWEAEFLIIDDIDTGIRDPRTDRPYMQHRQFEEILMQDLDGKREAFTRRTVVWVLGAGEEDAPSYIEIIKAATAAKDIIEVPLLLPLDEATPTIRTS